MKSPVEPGEVKVYRQGGKAWLFTAKLIKGGTLLEVRGVRSDQLDEEGRRVLEMIEDQELGGMFK